MRRHRWQPYLVLVEARLGALAETLGLPEHGEVSVKLTDDRQISELNRGFRDKSGATNVCHFRRWISPHRPRK